MFRAKPFSGPPKGLLHVRDTVFSEYSPDEDPLGLSSAFMSLLAHLPRRLNAPYMFLR